MMAELFTFMHIRDVYFNARAFQTANTILQGDAGMSISSSIEYYTIIGKTYFLQFVD